VVTIAIDDASSYTENISKRKVTCHLCEISSLGRSVQLRSMFKGIHEKTEKEQLTFATPSVNSGQNGLDLTFGAYFEFDNDFYSS
jgi:hypothetical protein